MSNPAFGFRSKLSDENKSKYDSSYTRSRVEPSKGLSYLSISKTLPDNIEKKLETRGEAEFVKQKKTARVKKINKNQARIRLRCSS